MNSPEEESDEDRLRRQLEWAADALQAGREVFQERARMRAQEIRRQQLAHLATLQLVRDART
jgi:hypothetical protein